jgi:hypothetical protein
MAQERRCGPNKRIAALAEQDLAEGREVRAVLLHWLLFETKVGEALLALLERTTGLAVVSAERLGTQPSEEPS